MNHVIVAPHPDDEIIGTYEILRKKEGIVVIYSGDLDADRRETVLKLKEKFDKIKLQLFQQKSKWIIIFRCYTQTVPKYTLKAYKTHYIQTVAAFSLYILFRFEYSIEIFEPREEIK